MGDLDFNIQTGMRLQNARLQSGYTIEEFAKTLNISNEHYRKLESGAYRLSAKKMQTLYKVYQIDPAYLITGERRHTFHLESYLKSCSKEEHDLFLWKIVGHFKHLLKQQI